jgi:peptide/nickel transport system substrate-binding protein
MLTTAGYPKGFSLTLQVDSKDSTEGDVAQLIENEWAKVGVQVTIDSLSTTALEANRMSRSYDLLMHQFNVNDPVNILLSFNGAVGNTSALYLSTEPFAAMYQTIINDTDLTKQTSDIKQMALAVLADAGYIPFADPVELNCYWPWLKNYYGETDAGYSNLMPMISELWIDPSLIDNGHVIIKGENCTANIKATKLQVKINNVARITWKIRVGHSSK